MMTIGRMIKEEEGWGVRKGRKVRVIKEEEGGG